MLEFLNKGSRFSSITGEKLSEMQVSASVQRGFQSCGLEVELFTLCPQWDDPPGYVLLTECQMSADQQRELTSIIDRNLGEMNCEYANRLETGRLRPLVIRILPPGTFAAYRDAKIARLGGSLEQFKHPNLVNDVHFADKMTGIRSGRSALASAS